MYIVLKYLSTNYLITKGKIRTYSGEPGRQHLNQGPRLPALGQSSATSPPGQRAEKDTHHASGIQAKI